MITVAVIGMGGRGRRLTREAKALGAKIVAVCDANIHLVREEFNNYDIPENMLFSSDDEFFKAGKLADLLIIATQDALHYKHAMAACECGYDCVLEKPISTDYARCEEICNKANEKGVKIFVCHSMRYMPFFEKVKEIVDSGKIGEIRLLIRPKTWDIGILLTHSSAESGQKLRTQRPRLSQSAVTIST